MYIFKLATTNYKKAIENPPGTRGGPSGRDRTLALKRRKKPKIIFFSLKKIKITLTF